MISKEKFEELVEKMCEEFDKLNAEQSPPHAANKNPEQGSRRMNSYTAGDIADSPVKRVDKD